MAGLISRLLGRSKPTQEVAEVAEAPRAKPIHVTDDEFASVILQADKPALVDLWAEWCGPCHMIAPIVEELAENYGDRVVVAKLDVDHNPQTPARYGVMGIPTLLIFNQGALVDQIVGVRPYRVFQQKLDALLNDS
ncbi:MAG TPA: thioredoxin [Anaerolineae bacterium]|nr:thioredoxin [Anaerolineae bacterium]